MNQYPVPADRWHTPLAGWFLRLAASGWAPGSWFRAPLPSFDERAARTGHLRFEVVSHCWQYAHFLIYQLSSLVRFPPRKATVTMTVYYSSEDRETAALLEYFGAMDIPGVEWNWRDMPPPVLFRRAIGRNQAALDTRADWIWFTDCDLMFRRGCLDALADELQGRRDMLVYPRIERVTPLLADEDPMLNPDLDQHRLVDIDDSQFSEHARSRATGPLQITHGDVARAVGYCDRLTYYQRPSPVWCKAHEDRAFRWLLGSQGVPLDIPGVYRIRHTSKGRYTGSEFNTRMRSGLRRGIDRFRENR